MKLNFSTWKDVYAGRNEPENLRSLTEGYWRALLLFTVLGILGSVAYGIWEFIAVTAATNAVATDEGRKAPAVLDKAKLDETLRQLQSRQAAFETAKVNQITIPDPSK